jgi:hypothetical protein
MAASFDKQYVKSCTAASTIYKNVVVREVPSLEMKASSGRDVHLVQPGFEAIACV